MANEEEMKSIEAYKGRHYKRINDALREATEFAEIGGENLRDIQNIDKVLKQGDEIRLYRGLRDIESFLQMSNVLVHKNYCSASKSLEVAKRFSSGGCCILTFLLPANMKRFDYNDMVEREVLIERNIQFTISPSYRMIDFIKVFDAVISPYEPPKIDKELARKSSRELDILMIGEAWKNEMPQYFSQADVDVFLESKKPLSFPPEVYKTLRAMLVAYAKTT